MPPERMHLILTPQQPDPQPTFFTKVPIPHPPGWRVVFCIGITMDDDGRADFALVRPKSAENTTLQQQMHVYAFAMRSLHACIEQSAAKAGDADQFITDTYKLAERMIDGNPTADDAEEADPS